ncbi:MAG: DUF1727 domain-containing protein, partial [Firmicutes bacterium]|nr:DUF1727 domain-containing protein [Bacillota bacterium]
MGRAHGADVLPQAVAETRPKAIVVTNLFRDQLDRYGEVDYVAGLWRAAFANLPPSAVAILNADDPLVASLGEHTRAAVLYYGIEDPRYGSPRIQHATDSARCRKCGLPFQYEVAYFSHMGRYSCPRCGLTRPRPAVY